MDQHIHGCFLRDQAEHGPQLRGSEFFHCYDGCLQDDRDIQLRCRLYNRACGQIVENIESAYRVAFSLCLLKFLQKCFLFPFHFLPPNTEYTSAMRIKYIKINKIYECFLEL